MSHERSAEAARDLIYNCLEELTGKQFKEFKTLLQDHAVKLENADRLDIAEAMIERYNNDTTKAFEITLRLLECIRRIDLLEDFNSSVQRFLDDEREDFDYDDEPYDNSTYEEEDSTDEEEDYDYEQEVYEDSDYEEELFEDNKKKYKEYIQNKFREMEDNDRRTDKSVNLKEMYTKLLIVKKYPNMKDKEHEIISYGQTHLKLMAERAKCSYSSIKDLFSPKTDGHVPRIVVLQGVAGIGKTMTARKIMFDWARGNLFQDRFEFVFYIHCRECNQLTAKRAFAELIMPSIEEKPLLSMSEIEANPEKLLFIIDGFDELKVSGDLLSDDPDKKLPKGKTIFSLISKRYLAESYIIITTRPTALGTLEKCVEDKQLTEILGFSEDDREEYFRKFFEDEDECADAIRFAKETEIVYTMCFVPIVCRIVCTVIKEQMEHNKDSLYELRMMTPVYLRYLFNLLKQEGRDDLQQKITNNLKRLCALAVEGVYEQKILFEEGDLEKHGVDIPALQGLFLNKNIFKKSTENVSFYSFVHLSVQEFFAALFYILQEYDPTAENRKNPQRSVIQLLKDFTESKNNHLMLTVRFLFGLLNKELLDEMKSKFQWKVKPTIKPALRTWITGILNKEEINMTDQQMDLFHCLFETQDEDIVKIGTRDVNCICLEQSLIKREINSMDFKVLTFCLKDSELWRFDLQEVTMTPEDVRTLKPLLIKCSTLTLDNCFLTDSCCEVLASVLKTNTSLEGLWLNGSKLGNSGVKKLCEGLKYPDCELQELRLDNCFLTESCCEVLASVFKTKKSLEGLWLNGSKLGDSGVKKLCEGLKHPDCELQELRLENCFLTDSCCEDLASVLKANTSLEGLWLNGNKLGDYGVKTLCKGLKHPNCELQELRLIDCSLTDSCCEDLSSVLTANTSIVNLYLGDNDLGYPGVKKLCEDLEHTNHILEILCICGNELSDECSGDPCKTLQKKLEPPQQDITTALIASFQKVFEERKLSGLLSHVKMDQKENSETTENMINPSLEELSGKQFKEFKIRLQLYAEKREQSSIQKLRLENADRLDTAKAMIEHYGHRSALEITKHLMGKILKNNRVKKSEHSVQTCEITFKFSESSVAADTFIRIHRLRLIDRMGNIKSVMDILEYKEILQKEEVEEVLAEKISRSQNSRLIRMVEMKGKESMQEFLLALQKKNPPLFRDLMSATETK